MIMPGELRLSIGQMVMIPPVISLIIPWELLEQFLSFFKKVTTDVEEAIIHTLHIASTS